MSQASRNGGWRGGRLDAVARGLGWLSLGLGLAEVVLPRRVAGAAGVPGRDELVQAYGWREIAAGVGILAARNPAPWIWARVGGDALDLATLGAALPGRRPTKTAMAIAAVLGITALDVACARSLRRERGRRQALVRDYGRRSGFPLPPEQMRGAALADPPPPVPAPHASAGVGLDR